MRDYLKPKMAKPAVKRPSSFLVTVGCLILINVAVILYHGDPSTKLGILSPTTKSKLLSVDPTTKTSVTLKRESNNDILPPSSLAKESPEKEVVSSVREAASSKKAVGVLVREEVPGKTVEPPARAEPLREVVAFRSEAEHQQEKVVTLPAGDRAESVRGESTAFRALSRLKERLIQEIPAPQGGGRSRPDFILRQEEGQSPTRVLVKAGISGSLTHLLLQKFADHINFHRLMPGTAYNFWFDGAERLQCIEIWPMAKRGVRAQLRGDNWSLQVIGEQYVVHDPKDRVRPFEVGRASNFANLSVALSSP